MNSKHYEKNTAARTKRAAVHSSGTRAAAHISGTSARGSRAATHAHARTEGATHGTRNASRASHSPARAKKSSNFALPFLIMLATVCLILMIGAFSYGMASANNNPESAEYVGLRKMTSAKTSVGELEESVRDTEKRAKSNANKNAQGAGVNGNAGGNAGDASGTNNAAGSNTSNNATTQGTSAQTQGDLSTTSSGFNITAAASKIDEKHEQARAAAEAEQKRKDEEAKARAEEMQKKWNASDALSGLEEVDWSVGESAFIDEWTGRIDNYLKGTALAGYGATFARAAWENGIDPRWSPAISNTESGNGANCFLPHNAWGWGSSSWGSWEEAINGHVAGLARGYGYSITYEYAKKYCPPNTDFWFNNTLNQMKKM